MGWLKRLWTRPRTRISVRVIADSINPFGDRISTLEGVFNRYLLAEFNTHRMMSRNSASSRAIPVKRMLAQVLWDPATPIHWGTNRPGMQARDELTGWRRWLCRRIFLLARFPILLLVWILSKLGLHKQVVNRLLEPWVWHTLVFTATDFRNFFKLRLHPDAQPEFQEFARCCRVALDGSTPRRLDWDEWHLPYIDVDDRVNALMYDVQLEGRPREIPTLPSISVARCAAVSYVRQGERRDVKKDLDLVVRLMSGGHWSPFEHVARADPDDDGSGNFTGGWRQLRKDFMGEDGRG